MLLLCGGGSSAAAAICGAAATTICGDADGDGAVTTSDGVRILQVAAALTDCCTEGCDLDGDGRVTTADGRLALRRAAGLDIVDRCGTGTITGRLLVPPRAAAASTDVEREANDDPGSAASVGRIASAEVHRLAGTITPNDPFDGYAFVADADLVLDLTLTFPSDAGIDLDLLVDDRRGGSATCESTTRGSEHCLVTIGSDEPKAFDVVVASATGSLPAAYTLIVGSARSDCPPGVTPGPGAGAPLDLEPAVYRGDAAAIVPGEIVMRIAPTAASAPVHASRARMQTALAAVVGAAGIADGIAAEAVAPDGTMLLTLPESSESPAAMTSDPASGLAAKRRRAAKRAHTRTVAAALAASPGVLAAQPNRLMRPARVPGDPLYPQQWPLDALDLPSTWDITIGSASVIVAVIDTGIRSDHPDLAGRLVAGFDFITSPTRANDGDGIDPDPFDPGDQPLAPEGGSFHGTHVAGTIAATTDNARGIAGVTWRTAVMPLRVLGVGGGTIFDVAQAIRYAAGLSNVSGEVPPTPARIINLSLTTSGDDLVLRSAVDAAVAAGALVIAAAGNTGRAGFLSPAGFPNVLSVAATDRLGAPAPYSSLGTTVDLAAPGGDTHRDRDADGRPDGILSTLLPGHEDYALLQGTSMASAHVSGVAALLAGTGALSAPQLREVLLTTADDRGAPGRDDRYGAGLVDPVRAARTLTGLAPPTEPRLTLATSSLRVSGDESTATVPFRNAGVGALVLTAPTAVTDNGASWLDAAVEGKALRLAIDRDALSPGLYSGQVRVTTNGGAAEVAVLAEVAASPPEDLGPVTVLLRDRTSHRTVATTTITAAEDYRYRLDGVVPGHYEILASTDRDGDGQVCDVGEECGAYPARSAPTAVTVFGGATVRARDFELGFVLVATDSLPGADPR